MSQVNNGNSEAIGSEDGGSQRHASNTTMENENQVQPQSNGHRNENGAPATLGNAGAPRLPMV